MLPQDRRPGGLQGQACWAHDLFGPLRPAGHKPEVDPLMAGEAAAMTAMIWGLSLVFAALFKVRRPF